MMNIIKESIYKSKSRFHQHDDHAKTQTNALAHKTSQSQVLYGQPTGQP